MNKRIDRDNDSLKGNGTSDFILPGVDWITENGASLSERLSESIQKRVHLRAVINWLSKYRYTADSLNSEKIRGYLEAFYHLCEVEAWSEACEILSLEIKRTSLKRPRSHGKLWDQLRVWGYYKQEIELYSQLIGNLNPDHEILWLNRLANAHEAIGEYKNAVHLHQKCSDAAAKYWQFEVLADSLNNLGNAYLSQGETQKAAEGFQRSLVIAKRVGYREGEANSLHNLGITYLNIGRTREAITSFENSLLIQREIGDKEGEANSLNSLGNSYSVLKNHEKTKEYSQLALEIFKEIEYRRGEVLTSLTLAIACLALGQYETAKFYIQSGIRTSEEIGFIQGKGKLLSTLSEFHNRHGNYKQAIEYAKQALSISENIDDSHSEIEALRNLGHAHHASKAYDEAVWYNQMALKIAKEKGYKRIQSFLLIALGKSYLFLEEYQHSIESFLLSIRNSSEMKDRELEADGYFLCGILLSALGYRNNAISLLEKSRTLYQSADAKDQVKDCNAAILQINTFPSPATVSISAGLRNTIKGLLS